jgi:DNA-binding CsgD family transcriptional regulator
MYLTYRDTKVEDVALALPHFQHRLPHLKGRESQLGDLLRDLVSTKLVPTIVVEDRDLPEGQRLVGFSLGFFANEDFHRFIHDQKRSPYLASHVLEWWSQGRRPDIPAETFQQEQLKGGGSMVFLVKGVDSTRYQGPELNHLREHASIAFIKRLFTYRIRSFADEVYGPEELARLRAFGMELYNDFGNSPDMAPDAKKTQPYMVGVETEKLRQDPGQTASIAKRYALMPKPRFGFTPREQDILRLAVLGSIDREIASALGLSLIGVKKRWESIYARIPDLGTEGSGDEPLLKRRALMQLLADHPEEFWPNKRKGAVSIAGKATAKRS